MIFKGSSASLTGLAHQHSGIPCQDSVCIHREEGIFCGALADGAGSRDMSHLGAECVTHTVCRLLCSQFHRLYEAGSAKAVREILDCCLEALGQLSYPIHALASTLLFFAADSHGRFLSGHLGDGVMIAVEDYSLRLFSPPENGEDSGVTWFVNSPDAESRFRIRSGRLWDHGAMLLMSDGMAAGLYHSHKEEPAPACATLAKWLREGDEDVISSAIRENMQSLFARRSPDDLSLIVISW